MQFLSKLSCLILESQYNNDMEQGDQGSTKYL